MPEFLPEWHPQWGVMIAWPHANTDWVDNLTQAENCYIEIAYAILAQQKLLIVHRDAEHQVHIQGLLSLAGAKLRNIHWHQAEYNDTWTRDYGPLAVGNNQHIELHKFTFNGWGEKFESAFDNQVSSNIDWQTPLHIHHDFVLEGGAIESDGRRNLLTTEACLLNPNRNPNLTRKQVEERLRQNLKVRRIWWLKHGYLAGDDTDSHVDTLARFCNAYTIAYMQCNDPQDEHYTELKAMEQELFALATLEGFDLLPLPLPPAQYAQDGHRLPATYANFLIINGKVLVPTYACATDEAALERIASAMPDYQVIGIDCRALIEQHGSLHCITMQIPKGVL